jgi:DNA polymerase V
MRYIGLLDCNNFFVSCERLFRPDLWRRPVVVLSSNDGCIVARSQEVKDLGVPMGVPYFQVKGTLMDAGTTVFSSHFTLYRDISRRIFSELQHLVGVVEQYSIDESFFVLHDNPYETACHIRTQIERAVGVPVSIGVASTKTQAKYANAVAKQGSRVEYYSCAQFMLEADDIPLHALWGVGRGRSRAFTAAQLRTVADVQRQTLSFMQSRFGVEGARLHQELRGTTAFAVVPQRLPQKSVMSSRSFRSKTTERAVVEDALAYHIHHTATDVRAQGQGARAVTVSLRPSRHGAYALRGGRATEELVVPSDDPVVLGTVAQRLLRSLWQPGIPYAKVGVCLHELMSPDVQPPLPELSMTPEAPQAVRDRLWRAVDHVNRRHGSYTVAVGRRMRRATWEARRDALSPAYTTRWHELPVARAT